MKQETMTIKGEIHAVARKGGKIIWEDRRENVICRAGLARLAGILTGDITTLPAINYCALGTGTATPTTDDTKLQTETYRNLVASGYSDQYLAYFTAYFNETETSGTFKEFGVFINGTASADSGYIFNHIGGLTWVKDTATTLSVDIKFTLATA